MLNSFRDAASGRSSPEDTVLIVSSLHSDCSNDLYDYLELWPLFYENTKRFASTSVTFGDGEHSLRER